MKRKNSILSLLLVLTMVVSAFAALPMTAFADNSGGTLLYESFEGIASSALTPQPTGTTITANGRTEGNDSGAGLGYYGKQDNAKGKHFNATLPASYLGSHTDTTAVAAQGPNAKLTLEFDYKFDEEIPTSTTTLMAVLLGNDSLSGNGKNDGRAYSAVAVYLTSPNKIIVYNKAGSPTECFLPEGITFDKWHRYQLTVNLTNASSAGVKTYAFTVDGEYILDDTSKEITSLTSQLPATEITKLRMDTPTYDYTSSLDNVSVYKTTASNAALSTGALMTKLHEVNAKLAGYQAAAAGTEVLTNLEAAVTAAGTMVTTAFGTYNASGAVVTAAKNQADVDTALTNLTEAQAALEAYLASRTYPGGVLVYESFTGIVSTTGENVENSPTTQPGTATATIKKKNAATDSGAGLGNYAKQDGTYTDFTATIPTAYFAGHTETAVVAAQGPNAKLTMEFDFKFDGEVPTDTKTLTAVSIGNSSVAADSAGRGNAAIAIYLQSPNKVRVYSSTSNSDKDVYYLPTGITFDQWHRYQLAVDLTDANSEGASTYTFTVDGKNIFDAEVDGKEVPSFTKKLSATEITKLRIDTTNAYTTRLDNVSVYKTNKDNEALSTGALMTKLHEVNAKMALYRAAAEGIAASQLATFEAAVAAAGNMVTTAYGTYDAEGAVATAAKTQADVDAALANLKNAETSLKAVLPYYVISEHNIDETDYITAVTVGEITAYTGSPVKLIAATFDADGLSEVSMQDFTGAGEYVLTTPLSVTDKSVAVFVWEMNDLIPLADIYSIGEAVVQD